MFEKDMQEISLNEYEAPKMEEVTPDNESDLLKGLLEAASYKTTEKRKVDVLGQEFDDEGNRKKLFSFYIRPISDEELVGCRKKAMKTRANRANRRAGNVEEEVDISLFRCWKIYTATIDEDRKKIWESPAVKNMLIANGHSDIVTAVDVIEAVFSAGQKDQIDDLIDEISGWGENTITLEEYAKN